MGTDNLHHKRKARGDKALDRKRAKRAPYDKVLIVCEGEKTEPNYFNELIQHYELNTANVRIDGSSGSSPQRVFEKAKELYEAAKKSGDPFDRVYCVFDKDSHACYAQAVQNIETYNVKNTFYTSVSVPCFEYWLLLHFTYSTRPYQATSTSSIANQVLIELRKFMPDYNKVGKGVFLILQDKIEIAKDNARKSLQAAERNGTDNPSTRIHELVEYLQNLKA